MRLPVASSMSARIAAGRAPFSPPPSILRIRFMFSGLAAPLTPLVSCPRQQRGARLDADPVGVIPFECLLSETEDLLLCNTYFTYETVMPQEPITPKSLGQLLQRKRGSMGVRAAAAEIGISPATLSRMESGRVPDLETLRKVCAWIG